MKNIKLKKNERRTIKESAGIRVVITTVPRPQPGVYARLDKISNLYFLSYYFPADNRP